MKVPNCWLAEGLTRSWSVLNAWWPRNDFTVTDWPATYGRTTPDTWSARCGTVTACPSTKNAPATYSLSEPVTGAGVVGAGVVPVGVVLVGVVLVGVVVVGVPVVGVPAALAPVATAAVATRVAARAAVERAR